MEDDQEMWRAIKKAVDGYVLVSDLPSDIRERLMFCSETLQIRFGSSLAIFVDYE